MTPPSLQIYDAQVANCFASRDAGSARQLASLVNSCTTESLETVVQPVLDHLYLLSSSKIAEIDALLQYLSLVASNIESGLQGGTKSASYRSTDLRPSSGPGILAERLSHSLHEKLWEHTSRDVTPQPDNDKNLEIEYYQHAAVYGTILARGFATQPSLFRGPLWREVEDVFVKALFSEEPEPGVYVVVAALLLGAGPEIKAYLTTEGHVGQGKDWLWYDDVRTRKGETWGWSDIIAALEVQPGMIGERLPDYVKSSFGLAKDIMGGGQIAEASWDSSILAQRVFPWK
ncbi:hypothetical protein AX15_000215 [Amanita polypyramis BW_CC]|nr:hypothetical protein AX15_000215 [Amanita polypyramis BW_CC]